MGMEIDRLEIMVEAQARSVSNQIDGLYTKLGKVAEGLNKTANGYRTAARDVGRLSAAFRSLASVRIPDFSNLIQQMEMLSKIDFKMLANKKFNIDIEVNAPKSAADIQWAIQKAIDEVQIDSDKFADRLISQYHITGKGKAAIRSAVAEMTRELSSGFNGDSFTKDVSGAWVKIKETLLKYGSLKAELIEDYGRINEALSHSDFVISKIGFKDIRTKLSDISDKSVEQNAEETVIETTESLHSALRDKIKNSFDAAIKNASHELTLDIDVNQDKIVYDIKNAINKAAKMNYDAVEVKLNINKQGIQDNVTRELQNISAGNLTAVSSAYERLFQTLMSAHTTLGKSGSINNIVNALTRLAKVDLRTFDTGKLNEIVNAIASLASIGDVPATIAKVVSALARLASVGETVGVTAKWIPALGYNLQSAFERLASVNLNEITERVLTAFTRLAMSGDRAEKSAKNLPGVTSAINGFFQSLAQAPAVSDATVRMVEAFTQLSTTGRRIGSVGNQINKSFNSLSGSGDRASRTFKGVGINANSVVNAFNKLVSSCRNTVKGLGTGVENIKKQFKSIGEGSKHVNKAVLSLTNLLKVAVGFYGIRTLLTWGKEAVEFSSDLTEVQNVVENSFGTEGTKNIEEFAKRSIDSFGMSELTFKQVASRYQAMGNAMGITTGQIASANEKISDKMIKEYQDVGDGMGNMSARLTMLAADMASFYNVEQSTVAEALNAVYTGQTRPLRQYGLDLTQATLQEWALKQGIDADMQSMSQAEKTILRYQYVLSQTSTIQGDFARTQDTWANQIRILKQNLQALGGVLGGTLINAFKPLIMWLNRAMSAVISFAETIGNALGKIFGWKVLHTPASNAADAYNTLSDGLEETGTSGDDAASGINNATKAAEEYKNTVLGFDELNKLNDVPDPTSSSGNGSGGGSGGSGGSSTPGADGVGADFQIIRGESWLEAYESEIDSLFELGAYIKDVLVKAMDSINWDAVYERARGFGTGLADFLNGLLRPDLFRALGATIAGAINTVLNAADAFADRFDFHGLGVSFAAGITSFFNTFDFGLSAEVFYKLVNGVVETMTAAFANIEFKNIGSKISDAVYMALSGIDWNRAFLAARFFGLGLAEFLNGLIKPSTFWMIGETVANRINTALHILNNFGTTFDFEGFGESIAAAIRGFFLTWDPELTADTFNNLALGILEAITAAISSDNVNWTSVGSKIRTMLVNIKWEEILKSVGTMIMGGINAALDFAKGLFKGTPIYEKIEEMKTKINELAGMIDFDSIKKGLQDILDVGGQFTEGFMSGFVTVFKDLADIGVAVLWGIGGALKIIGDALSAIDPEWVNKLGTALGMVAAAIVTINAADKVVGIVTGLKNSLLGIETAGAGAAVATGEVAAGTATVGVATKSTLSKVAGLAKELLTSTGAMLGFAYTGAVSVGASLQSMEETSNGFNGKLTEMGGLFDTLAVNYLPDMKDGILQLNDDLENSDATVEEAAAAFAEFFKGQHIDPRLLQKALGSALESAGGTYEQMELVNLIMEKFNGTTETTTGKIHGFASSLDGAKKAASDASGIKDSIGGAMDSIKEKSEKADEKSSLFKTNLFGFAGGAFAQSLLLAVLGTSFATMGDKAEGAQTPIETLETKVGGFVGSIATWATDALTKSKDVGANVPKGMEEGVEESADDLLKEINSTLIGDPQYAITHGWKTHSPSQVTYEYGENIVAGMGNAIRDKGSTIVAEINNIISNMQTAITGKMWEFNQAGQNLAESIKNGFSSVSFVYLADEILGQIDFGGLYSDMFDAGESAMESFANGMQSVYIPTPHVSFTQSVTGSGTSTRTSWSSSVSWYANGGFPNVGDLFVANEKKPEMVGRMGNRNVVSNNLQITEGIKSAVIDGMMQVYMSTNGNGNEIPYVFNAVLKTENDEVLARAVERGKARRDVRFNTVGYSYG